MIALIVAVAAAGGGLDRSPLVRSAGTLEAVYGVAADNAGVTVLVGGCAAMKSDYIAQVSRDTDVPTLKILHRPMTSDLVACGRARTRGPWTSPLQKEPDRSPATAAITWTYGELGLRPGQSFNVANPKATMKVQRIGDVGPLGNVQ